MIKSLLKEHQRNARKSYLEATKLMGQPSFSDVLDEVKELYQDRTLEELSDVVHSTCRYLRVPDNITWHLARPTARKHAFRMQERGCPRSLRNCEASGPNCCCRK